MVLAQSGEEPFSPPPLLEAEVPMPEARRGMFALALDAAIPAGAGFSLVFRP